MAGGAAVTDGETKDRRGGKLRRIQQVLNVLDQQMLLAWSLARQLQRECDGVEPQSLLADQVAGSLDAAMESLWQARTSNPNRVEICENEFDWLVGARQEVK